MRIYIPIIVLALTTVACSSSDSGPTTTITGAGTFETTRTTETDTSDDASVPPTTTDAEAASRSTPSTTSTTRPPRTTTTATTARPPRTTTTTAQALGNPPSVSITSPGGLARYEAVYDAASGEFFASVPLSASFTDPDGDPVTIEWYSDTEGFLGTGASITARLRPFGDASQPVITAVATDRRGASSRVSRQIIVWIPSDQ